jgi:hypothetical protein
MRDFVPADEPLVENADDGSHELRCRNDGSVVAHVRVPDPVGGYTLQTHHVWVRVRGEWITWREAAGLPDPDASTFDIVLKRLRR